MPGAQVTFKGLGKTYPAAPGQTICDVAEAHGIPLNAECHSGICGSDPIRIVAGHENLAAAPSGGEAETLEDICELEHGADQGAGRSRDPVSRAAARGQAQ